MLLHKAMGVGVAQSLDAVLGRIVVDLRSSERRGAGLYGNIFHF